MVKGRPVRKVIGGVTFEDRFIHLEDDSPEALAFQRQCDAAAARTAQGSANYAPIRDRLRKLRDLPQGQAATVIKPPCKRGQYWFEIAFDSDGEALRIGSDPLAIDRTLTTRRALASELGDPDLHVELFWLEPSPRGRFVALGWLTNGEQRGTISIFDSATGATVTQTSAILYTEARPGWLPDESGFWLNDRDTTGEHRLRFVPVVEAAMARPVVPLPKHLIGETTAGVSLRISPDGRRGIGIGEPHEHIALFQIDFSTFRVEPFLPDGWEGDCDGNWIDDGTFVARIHDGNLRGRVVAIPVSTSRDPATWRELVAPGEGILSWVAVVAHRLYVGDFVDVSVRVRVFDLDGGFIETLALDAPGSLPSLNYDRALRPSTDVFTFTQETFSNSTAVYLHDGQSSALRRLRPPAHHLNDVAVEQKFATSRDGARIPYFTVHRSDLDRSRPQPVLVFAYGGFNTSFLPLFPTIFVPFIEAGGIFVQANLRGGGEYGKRWHDGGRLESKWNTFHDLEAVVTELIAQCVTTADLTAFHGVSNGGLTAGAAIVFQPQYWRVVVPAAAIYDIMDMVPRTPETTWILDIVREDYGDPSSPDQARAIFEWSPYQNIRDGVRYPAVFQVFGAEDSMCRPFQGRKFTARLIEANSGDRSIHMRVWPDTGHSPAADAPSYHAEWLAFVMDELGMSMPDIS